MLTLFYFAIPVGSGLGYIVGSSVAEAMGDWSWALRVTPPLGIICVVLVFIFLHEPQRGQSDGAVATLEKTRLIDDLKYFARVRSLIWLTVGFTCVCFAIGALSWWAPTYMKYAYQVNGVDMTDDRF
jgi:MFS family permease